MLLLLRISTLGLIAMTFFACATTTRQVVYYKITVKEGDSLAAIATRFGTTWEAIAKDNGLNDDRELQVGMVLKVKPGPGGYLAGTKKVAVKSSGKNRKGFLFAGATSGTLRWPVENEITSGYGMRGRRPHQGIDIKASRGTSIMAAAQGRVSFSGKISGYGQTVIIDHGDVKTLYAHLSKRGVDEGDQIMRGEYIGQAGSSGNAQGPHLHFEVRNSEDRPLNPLTFLESRSLFTSR